MCVCHLNDCHTDTEDVHVLTVLIFFAGLVLTIQQFLTGLADIFLAEAVLTALIFLIFFHGGTSPSDITL